MSLSSKILVRPLVTEQLNRMSERQNQYGFVVSRTANKIEIKRAVEEYYSVTVLRVNTMNYLGKPKARMTKQGIQRGRTSSYKKAIVTLQDGDKIDFFSNI